MQLKDPKMRRTNFLWLTLSLAIILADQLTKYLIEANFLVFETVRVTSFFNLTLVYNQGAAFSFLADQGGWQRWFFAILAVAVTAVLMIWLVRLKHHERLVATSLSLIIGGAVGNLIDRVRFGHVVDFLDFYYKTWHWPAFNVADSAITIGVALMIIDALFPAKAPARAEDRGS